MGIHCQRYCIKELVSIWYNQFVKPVVLFIIFLAIIGAVIFAFLKPSHQSIGPTPTPTSTQTSSPTSEQTQLCQTNQINATITSQGAAGSIYGKLTMKNISDKSCHVTLGNTIKANFTAANISFKYQENPPATDFVLEPNATVYSQVRLPNGPQCQSGISPKEITFTYNNISFATTNKTPLMIQSCTSPSEQTVVDIWPLSKTPITP